MVGADFAAKAKGRKSPLPVGWPPEAEDEVEVDEMAFWGDSPHPCDQQQSHNFEAVAEGEELDELDVDNEVEDLGALFAASPQSRLLRL